MGCNNLHVVFLCETKLHEKELENVRRKCGMDSCFRVGSEGRSGGLATMWKHDITLSLRSFSKNHIDMEIEQRDGEQSWCLIRIYGKPDTNRKKETWRLLRDLAIQTKLSWCCFGNFNEILWDHEKSRRYK